MEERRLAAIMFTDIVGYTALMGRDEGKGLKLLRKNRKIQQQLIDDYKGRCLKEMGDGILAQFNSAADAVQCAIQIQEQARKELDGKIRIGIHLGDVTFENEDVFGDGVNIAARLQSIADPGGIYISEPLQNAIRAKSDIQTKYLGAFNLKNVDYRVRTYSIQGEDLPVSPTSKIEKLTGRNLTQRIFGSVITYLVLGSLLLGGGWWIRKAALLERSTISSILVLPFDNFTGSDSLDYFVDGMHASLITDISKIGAIRVISKTTARKYKDSEKSIQEIAAELNVDNIIEGSVTCLDDGVCLQLSAISADLEEEQLWTTEYKEDKSQILNLYNRVAKEFSKQISIILTPLEESLLSEARTVDNKAYDAYLRGQFYLDQINDESLKMAIKYFKIAIEIDPDWAAPYAGLAEVGSYQKQMGFVPSSAAISLINENLPIALKLDPNASNSHYVSAIIAVWTEWDWEKGEKEFLKALELNPSNALCRMFYAHLLVILRRSDEGLEQAKMAFDLDSQRPFILGLYAAILVSADECETALAHIENALSVDPDHYFAKAASWGAYACLGAYDKVFDLWKQTNIKLWEDYELTEHYEKTFQEHGWIGVMKENIKFIEEVLTKDRQLNPGEEDFLANKYMTVGNYDKAMDTYDKVYENHDPNLPYISTPRTYNKMKGNPRYIALLKKMNLPVD